MGKRKLPREPVTATIESLSPDGRGITRISGKAVFVDGALAGERVLMRYRRRKRRHDEAETVEVLEPSPLRVAPRCQHFGVCGGCSLQHLAAGAQVAAKQADLLDKLQRIGKTEPQSILPPLTAEVWGYRRKARLGAKLVPKKGRVLVGFREKRSPYLAEMSQCPVLHPAVGERLLELSELIGGLSAPDRLPQIEVALGDDNGALVFRHLDPLSEADRQALTAFGERHGLFIYLQPQGPGSVHPLWPQQPEALSYRLPQFDVELHFEPGDFTQVNTGINRQMVAQAVDLLQVGPEHRVLDLFCGLGNFSLPLARRAGQVIGVEGEAGLVARARANAERNGLANCRFHVADLTTDFSNAPWLGQVDRLLLDPPRSGALEIAKRLNKLRPQRIVYVSCDPATLARDCEEIVHHQGYRLLSAGVMDMFPHTAHVESMAVFERR